jgi:predicted transcriptional regulator
VSQHPTILEDHLISMIDGKPYRMLRKHIGAHGYTAESYREAFDLPDDYPMVAASLSRSRSALSKKIDHSNRWCWKQNVRRREADPSTCRRKGTRSTP